MVLRTAQSNLRKCYAIDFAIGEKKEKTETMCYLQAMSRTYRYRALHMFFSVVLLFPRNFVLHAVQP